MAKYITRLSALKPPKSKSMHSTYHPPGTPLSDVEKELFAQQHGVLGRILQGTKDQPSDRDGVATPSLADLFIASTYNGADFLHGKTKKRIQETLLQYRIDMHKARRFVLDGDFVEMATHLASTTPAKILARIQYATLPYDTTWIEFDLHRKLKTIRAIHGIEDTNYADITPRLGMLLQRINDTDAVCTLISEVRQGLMPHVSCYFFSTMETDFTDRGREFFGCRAAIVHDDVDRMKKNLTMKDMGTETDIDIDLFNAAVRGDSVGKASMWGYSGSGAVMGMVDQRRAAVGTPDVKDAATPQFLQRHGDVGMSRIYFAYDNSFPDNTAKNDLGGLLLGELREFTGQIRWLVTVLAMLNEIPVSTTVVERKGQVRAGTFRKHNFLDYHKVTLRLPKKNPVRHFERYLRGQSSRRRAHEVRSHWRNYMNEAHCAWEQHEWEYDNEEGYRLCGKCMAYSRLVHEHVRGDANLGWVRKSYVIKSGDQS